MNAFRVPSGGLLLLLLGTTRKRLLLLSPPLLLLVLVLVLVAMVPSLIRSPSRMDPVRVGSHLGWIQVRERTLYEHGQICEQRK